MTEPAAPFRFSHPVEVRFRDLDLVGHVHHSLPLVYCEEARAAYWREVAGRSGEDLGYIMASFSVSYLGRIRYPQVLHVYARVSRLGGKSWSMEYELRSAEGGLLATAESVQVMYEYASGSTVRIPAEVRERIEAYESA